MVENEDTVYEKIGQRTDGACTDNRQEKVACLFHENEEKDEIDKKSDEGREGKFNQGKAYACRVDDGTEMRGFIPFNIDCVYWEFTYLISGAFRFEKNI